MDKGPFRVQRPETKQQASAQTTGQPQKERVVEDMARINYSRQPQAGQASSKSSTRFIAPIIITLLLVAVAVLSWFAFAGDKDSATGATGINSGKYQAVFFTNGQVYFGKLESFSAEAMKLTDIFYLQTENASDASENPQSTASKDENSNVQLIKLGDEIHGPEDEMILSKEQVLFYENLKSDSKVAESIAKYKESN